jgi:hypothetical protein
MVVQRDSPQGDLHVVYSQEEQGVDTADYRRVLPADCTPAVVNEMQVTR